MRRERRKREFLGNTVATVIVAGLLAFAGGFVINQWIQTQGDRNAYLKTAVAKLDVEIAEIKTLEQAIAALEPARRR
jgi:Tfp pilus assembly protein PilN